MNSATIIIIIINIICVIAQAITMPLFIDSFTSKPEPYFVILYSVISQILLSLLFFFRQIKTLCNINLGNHIKLFVLSIFWTVSFMFTTFAGSASRTPPDVQTIIFQLFFPITFLLNIIRKQYSDKQKIAILIIFLGISVANIPMYISIGTGEIDTSNIIWIIVYTIGIFMSVCSNIIQETKLHEITTVQIIFWCNLYQLILSVLLFWINIVPNIGSYDTIDKWAYDFKKSIICNFHDCPHTWYLGLLNSISMMIACLTQIYLVKNIGTNSVGIIASICAPLIIISWFFIKNTQLYRLIIEIIGILVIIYGFYKYTKEGNIYEFADDVRLLYREIDNDGAGQEGVPNNVIDMQIHGEM